MAPNLIAALVMAGMVLGALVGMVVGKFVTQVIIREEAYKAGAGFWVCNPKTGRQRFAWVTEDKDEEETP